MARISPSPNPLSPGTSNKIIDLHSPSGSLSIRFNLSDAIPLNPSDAIPTESISLPHLTHPSNTLLRHSVIVCYY